MYTPGTALIAETITSIFAGSRPSEKFGTHSISLVIKVYGFPCLSRWFLGRISLKLFAGVNDLPALEGHRTIVHSKIIGNFAVIRHIEHRQVRLFPRLKRPDRRLSSQRIGTINRR